MKIDRITRELKDVPCDGCGTAFRTMWIVIAPYSKATLFLCVTHLNSLRYTIEKKKGKNLVEDAG